MVELRVIEKTEKDYTLQELATSEKHRFQIKFFDFDKEIVVGDVLLMNEDFLNRGYKEYSHKLMFGALDKPYGRKIETRDHPDLLCIKKDGEEYWLKRFWG